MTSMAGAVRIERIVSTGQASPADFWYDQDEDEWVVLLSGAAKLEFAEAEDASATAAANNEKTLDLKVGDWVLLPAHCRHRVAWTDPEQTSVWLAVFYPPQ